ncbi:MAG: hypothetical protein LBS88_04245 [Tannerellaceae bacterium]|jgi:hypothetical protein|nr:hypothetical protein [Tannerellaceae bacterium]
MKARILFIAWMTLIMLASCAGNGSENANILLNTIIPLIIIQTALAVLMSVFFRTYIAFRNTEGVLLRIPGIACFCLIALSLVPLVGIVANIFFVPVILVICSYDEIDIEIPDNRFTRFWIKR